MHDHGTAVLDGPAEATSVNTPGASARDQWLAQCESDLARALAEGNACLLPVAADSVFCPKSCLCPDCQGTGYTQDDSIDLCYCMADQPPAYDFPRHAKGEVLSVIGMSRRYCTGQAEVWVPCQQCDIGPIKGGPYLGDDVLRVPWVPDCPLCNDTGWVFSHSRPATEAFA